MPAGNQSAKLLTLQSGVLASCALAPETQHAPPHHCKMKLVGLTGGIASGKSSTSKLLADQGFVIIDCDLIARDVVNKGRWGYKRLLKVFGPDILDPNTDNVDREKLGDIVFRDPALRRRLNAALHLPIGLEIARQVLWHWLCCRRLVIIDMPLLFETGMNKCTHPTVCVYVDPGTQVRRLISRDGLSPEAAVLRVNSQMKLESKMMRSDIVINNEGSQQHLAQQVADLGADLRRKAGLTHVLISPLGLLSAALLLFGFRKVF